MGFGILVSFGIGIRYAADVRWAGLVAGSNGESCVSAPDYRHPGGENCARIASYCGDYGNDHGTQADGRSANEACCECGGDSRNIVFGRNIFSCNISDVTDPVLLMAYYFPQFHDVPENYPVGSNRSWTDWDNIKLALKHPDGADVFHPMESGALGYYNLTQVAPRRAQGQLAKKYGLDGFIFYHYWFNQGAVMDKPLLLRLKDGQPAGQFYFCWANEDWDMFYGRPRKGAHIVRYDYNRCRDHAVYLARFMSHPDYVKIGGRPVFSIYRAELLPLEYLTLLKRELLTLGIDVHLQLTTMNYGGLEPKLLKAGYYDSSMEFGPNLRPKEYIKSTSQLTEFRKHIEPSVPFKDIFYGVEIGFDPTARKLSMGTRHTKAGFKMEPSGFYRQMRVLFDQAYRECAVYNIRHPKSHPILVSLFAWNEWGEGATLEPTTKYGYQMLEAVQRARQESRIRVRNFPQNSQDSTRLRCNV